MASDKFKSVAATFQIFKDGEAVSARKLDGIIRKTQDGADKIQQSLGDMWDYGLALSGLPLFHNSIARAIGPSNVIVHPPIRVFDTPQPLVSRDQGLVRYPYSTASASDVGNKSLNLLPSVDQANKVGVGCTNDNGSLCLARFNNIYDEEKNILKNGLFNSQLNYWEASGILHDGANARLDTVTRYNTLAYSEDISNWTGVSGSFTDRAFNSPTGSSNVQMFTPDQDGTDLVYVELAGQPIAASTDWCLSVWLATSGQQTTTFLEIDEATHVRGTEGHGSVDPAGSIYAVDISGTAWNRYHVYGTFAAARTSGVARIHLGRGNVTGQDDKVFIWGAQLEPTTSPSTYQATVGSDVSNHVGEVWLGQTFQSVPKKWYQASIEWNELAGSTWSLVHNGTTIISNSIETSATKTFRGSVDDLSRFVGSRDANVHIYVSGSTSDTGTMALTSFRIDPGTPCHALNCPGFSAYEKTRSYRATLPIITDANSQFFGEQLRFPDEFSLSASSKLPANIMGVFDHEQNHTVPSRLVDWRLASWPIGNDIQAGFVNDPDFLTDWTTGSLNTYPTEFTPTVAAISGLERDSYITAFQDEAPITYLGFDGASDGIHVSGLGTGDTTGGVPFPTDVGNWTMDIWFNRASGLRAGTGTMETLYARGLGVVFGNSYIGVGLREETGHFGMHHNRPFYAGTIVNHQNVESDDVPGRLYTRSGIKDCRDGEWHHGQIVCISGTNADAGSTNWEQGQWIYVFVDGDLESSGVLYSLGDTPDEFACYDMNSEAAGGGSLGASEFGSNTSPSLGYSFSGLIGGFRIRKGAFNVDETTRATTNFVPQAPVNWVADADAHALYRFDEDAGIKVFDEQSIYRDGELGLGSLDEPVWGSGVVQDFNEDVPIDRLKISATDGVTQGIQKYFVLGKDEVATWVYTIRGDTGTAGVVETYLASSGSIDVDANLTGNWVSLATSTSLENTYQVSSTQPGETAWSKSRGPWYTITRNIRGTSANSFVTLSLELEGDDVTTAQTVFVDSIDLLKQSSTSSQFEYCADSILGLNWDGQATHVRDENLFQFSDSLLLWESTGLTRTIDTDSNNSVRIAGAGGSFYQSISGIDLLDDTFTLTWQSSTPNITSGIVTITQDSNIQNFDWIIYNSEVSSTVLFSGIIYETGANMEVRWTLYGDDAIVASPQLVHGSGIVDYIGTSSVPVKKYRRAIQPLSPQTVDTTWASGYALVEGGIIQTIQSGTIDIDGSSWGVGNTLGFPDEGVIRVAGQEYGYRTKVSGMFQDTVPGWRGTTFNPSAVASGSQVTNVSIPQSITEIDATTKEITFQDIIPAPARDWGNNLGLQIYSTHISNLDRFSLQSSAVPVTRAAGNLLTTFVQHVSDHRRHFRMSQMCGLILDSSSWAASPFIVAEASIVDQTVTELTEQAQLNVVAKRFVPNSDKEITISWGDGDSTVVTGTGNDFPRNSHTYDLKQIAVPRTYTIRVVVKDLDLDFSRTTTQAVTVSPKINSAGQSTKSTIRGAAKILLPATFGTAAGAKIKDQNTFASTAGAKMVLP